MPEDWRDVLRHAVPKAVAAADVDPARVIGISTDFTAARWCRRRPTGRR
jgi:L-ribulokinase